MKALFLVLTCAIGVSTTAQAAQKLSGNSAKSIIDALNILTKDGQLADSQGITYDSSSSQEGDLASDDVKGTFTEVTAKVGDQTVHCTSEEFLIFKAKNPKSKNYRPTYSCDIN